MLTKKAPELRNRLETMVKVDKTGDGIDYRLRTEPSSSRGEADQLCGELQNRGIQCLVIEHLSNLWERA